MLAEARASPASSGAPPAAGRARTTISTHETPMILALLQAAGDAAANVGNSGYAGAWGLLGAALGAGLATIGAGIEAMARQPEAAGDIRGTAIVLSAFIEGVALFAVVVTLLISLKFNF